MKPFMKKLLIPAGIAASIAVVSAAPTSGTFDLTGLNNQVQQHETRITTLETNAGLPTPTPTPVVITTTVVVPGATTTVPGAAPAAPTAPSVDTTAATPAPTEIPAPTPAPCVKPTPPPGGWQGNVACSNNYTLPSIP